MKCYFRLEETWVKGFITSFSGASMVSFSSEVREENAKVDFAITNTEVLFHGSQLTVSGYVQQPGDNMYRLVSVDVRFSKPRE